MFKLSGDKIKGITASAFTALFQGCEAIIFLFLGVFFVQEKFHSVGFSVATLAIKESLTFFLFFVVLNPKKIIKLFKTLKHNKDSRLFFYAGLFGTSVGNLFFLLAIQFAGAGYGVVLTALYPIMTLLLYHLINPKKPWENWKVVSGVIISIVGAFLFILVPSIANREEFGTAKIIGMSFGAVAALFWAIEGIIISKALKRKHNKSLTNLDIVGLRNIASIVFSVILLLPSTYGFSNISGSKIGSPFKIIESIFSDYRTIIIIFCISINLLTTRFLHVYSLSKLGPKLTSVIDSNNFLIPPFICIFLVYTHLHFRGSNALIFEPPVWWSWLLILPIIMGVLIVLINKKDIKDKKMEKILS